ncbi:hypothetical protein Salat_1683400 [Sesamum alatum]|uniref:Uncharacterized protein n=1 Tax=Sesamum alatum TaxID=300844 RepID=A0AAE1Y723_9LAMI|nr:hypothetical protein Salat_1683400 [Sesamum alatum]
MLERVWNLLNIGVQLSSSTAGGICLIPEFVLTLEVVWSCPRCLHMAQIRAFGWWRGGVGGGGGGSGGLDREEVGSAMEHLKSPVGWGERLRRGERGRVRLGGGNRGQLRRGGGKESPEGGVPAQWAVPEGGGGDEGRR